MIAARGNAQKARPPSGWGDPARIRDDLAATLEGLSRVLEQHAGDPLDAADDRIGPDSAELAPVRERLRFLGQVASGWQQLPEDALPVEGAGFGSTVVVDDMDRGGRETYTLMTGALLDIDAGQVSLASPIGQALVGAKPGSVVIVQTPQRQRRLRVVSVCTLRERLDADRLLVDAAMPAETSSH